MFKRPCPRALSYNDIRYGKIEKGEYLIGDKRYYTNSINYFRIRTALGFVEFLIKRKDEHQDKKEEKEDTTKKAFFFL